MLLRAAAAGETGRLWAVKPGSRRKNEGRTAEADFLFQKKRRSQKSGGPGPSLARPFSHRAFKFSGKGSKTLPGADGGREMQAFIGTSGFSYKEWKGTFYPEKIKAADMLAYYAQKLRSVEINNTFYRMPRRSVLEGWALETPESFQFAVKASRRITHFKKLKDTDELVAYLFQGLDAFGPRLGPLLFQLPPTFPANRELLQQFLSSLPQSVSGQGGEKVRVQPAFEFRHKSWFCEEIYDTLRQHGAALVSGDLDDAEKSPPLVATSEFAYLRLRKTDYSEAELADWTLKLQALGVKRVYAYFKHEELGPALAADLEARLG